MRADTGFGADAALTAGAAPASSTGALADCQFDCQLDPSGTPNMSLSAIALSYPIGVRFIASTFLIAPAVAPSPDFRKSDDTHPRR